MAMTMDTSANATAKDAPVIERVDVAADGDLVLLVSGKLELRVHSLLLKMNSPVFRAMLGPNWLEGQSLSSISETTPGTLALPDDDGDGMKYLCYILHHQNEHLSSNTPLPAMFLRIARVADKYNCSLSTKLAFEAWFYRIATYHYEHLAAAYVLDNPKWFFTLSSRVLLNLNRYDPRFPLQPGSANNNDEFGIIAALSQRYDYLCDMIRGGVSHVVENLGRFLGEDGTHFVNNAPGINPGDDNFDDCGEDRPRLCGYHQRMVPTQLTILAKANIWPGPASLEGLFAALKKLELPRIDRNADAPCDHDHEQNWYAGNYRTALEELVRMAYEANVALCLDCLKSPGDNDTDECRMCYGPEMIEGMNKQTYHGDILQSHISRVNRTFGVTFV